MGHRVEENVVTPASRLSAQAIHGATNDATMMQPTGSVQRSGTLTHPSGSLQDNRHGVAKSSIIVIRRTARTQRALSLIPLGAFASGQQRLGSKVRDAVRELRSTVARRIFAARA